MTQGLTKVPSSGPGQVVFLTGQVTFKAYNVLVQASHPLTKEYESCLPKEETEFEFFFLRPDVLPVGHSTKFPNFTWQINLKKEKTL